MESLFVFLSFDIYFNTVIFNSFGDKSLKNITGVISQFQAKTIAKKIISSEDVKMITSLSKTVS